MIVSCREHRPVPVKQGGTADQKFVLGKVITLPGIFYLPKGEKHGIHFEP
jgi:hypothetical protein